MHQIMASFKKRRATVIVQLFVTPKLRMERLEGDRCLSFAWSWSCALRRQYAKILLFLDGPGNGSL